MPSAFVKFPDTPHYCRDGFHAGLSACGYEIRDAPAMPPKHGDVLVLWNRYSRDEHLARQYEAAGGVVLVSENAFLGPEDKAHHWFALCRGHHNGAGTWFVGQRTRHEGLFDTIRPWRKTGDHVVIMPQRGMGEPGVRMELTWPADVEHRLRKITNRPIVVRAHPGPQSTWTPESIEMPELEDAWAAVVWASSAGIKALCAGIPVFYEFPKWIGADGGQFGIDRIEAPRMDGGRGVMLRKLSWAQWTADEIRSGEPFRCLLSLS